MTRITKDKVALWHQLLTETTGGSPGLRDEGLLESAIESAYATFDGKDLYPTKEEKAAKLCFSLISNHAFVDGNKRIAIHVMLTFLETEGIQMKCTDDELSELGWSLAAGKIKYQQLLAWIREHRK